MMISWRDLRQICKVCGERADFSVEYSNEDLPKNYLRDGTREKGYCVSHLPKEVLMSKAEMLEEVQTPHSGSR